jgi:isopentenyldiphosphate isomerase
LDAALRETQEEVGLNMKEQMFHFCGRLSSTQPYRKSKLVVCPFVFIQMQATTSILKLQQSEVAGVRWVSLNHFSDLPSVLAHHTLACTFLLVFFHFVCFFFFL